MGMDDREESYRSRGPSPRRRPYDGDDSPSRSAPRDPRDMSNPRSRPPRRDYDDSGYDRPARPPRDPRDPRDPRSSSRGSSGRNERDGYERDNRISRDGYERRPRSADGPRGDRRGNDNSYNSYDRPSRAGLSDPSASAARGDRSMRGGRPPSREDTWSDGRGPRVGGRSGSASASDGRMRRAAPAGGRGGLWGDDPGTSGNSARDLRARLMADQSDEEEESGSPAASIAKAIGAIALALVLGAGAAYGYFVISTPALHAKPFQQTVPSTTPSVSPSPSSTKSASLQQPASGPTLLIG